MGIKKITKLTKKLGTKAGNKRYVQSMKKTTGKIAKNNQGAFKNQNRVLWKNKGLTEIKGTFDVPRTAAQMQRDIAESRLPYGQMKTRTNDLLPCAVGAGVVGTAWYVYDKSQKEKRKGKR